MNGMTDENEGAESYRLTDNWPTARQRVRPARCAAACRRTCSREISGRTGSGDVKCTIIQIHVVLDEHSVPGLIRISADDSCHRTNRREGAVGTSVHQATHDAAECSG